jgi:hypothetical protein
MFEKEISDIIIVINLSPIDASVFKDLEVE